MRQAEEATYAAWRVVSGGGTITAPGTVEAPLDTAVHSSELETLLPVIASGVETVAARRLGNRDDARDASQETMARLVELVRAGRIATAAELAPVAHGIARHVISDMLRARAQNEGVPVDEIAAAGPDALDALVGAEERAALVAGLRRLAPRDRDLLRRCYVDGLGIEEIARALGERADRLRKRKSRALQRLTSLVRRLIDGDDGSAHA